ncbi:MAG: hypothetical protein ACI9OJ_004141 [Myxococcota bacterium]|jgi:hypothetical protein
MIIAALTVGCIGVTIPAEETSGEDTGSSTGTPVVTPDGQPPLGGPDAGSGTLTPTDTGQADDDAGVELPPSCDTHCDCPPAFDCINHVCVTGKQPTQCCSHPKCPPGDLCWTAGGVKGVCAE